MPTSFIEGGETIVAYTLFIVFQGIITQIKEKKLVI
jgi:hypothetical protein